MSGTVIDINVTSPEIDIITSGGQQGPAGANAVVSYATIAALRDSRTAPVGTTRVDTRGYAASGDGGHGTWWWDSTSTAADDSGLTVKLAAVATGRYKRLWDGKVIDPCWFGAVADPTTNSAPFVSAALTVAISLQQGARVSLPGGDFALDNLVLPVTTIDNSAHQQALSFEGAGSGQTVIYAMPGSTNPIISGDGIRDWIIGGFRIDGRPYGGDGVTKAASFGIDVTRMFYTTLYDLTITHINGVGFRNRGSASRGGSYYNNYDQVKIYNCASWGMDFDSNVNPGYIQAPKFNQVTCGQNGGAGTGDVRMRGVHLVEGDTFTVEGNSIGDYGLYCRNDVWLVINNFLSEGHTVADVDVVGGFPDRHVATKGPKTVTAIGTGATPVVTAAAHGFVVGDAVVLSGTDSTPALTGPYEITAVTTNTFTIRGSATVTVAGTAGTANVYENDNGYSKITLNGFSIPSNPAIVSRQEGNVSVGGWRDTEGDLIVYGTSRLQRVMSENMRLTGSLANPYGGVGSYGNYLRYSNDWTNGGGAGAWTVGNTAGSNPTITYGADYAPDGTLTASKIVFGSGTSYVQQSVSPGVTAVVGETWMLTLWARVDAGDINKDFEVKPVVVGGQSYTPHLRMLTTDWRPYTFYFPIYSGTGNLTVRFQREIAAQVGTMYVWSAQLLRQRTNTSILDAGIPTPTAATALPTPVRGTGAFNAAIVGAPTSGTVADGLLLTQGLQVNASVFTPKTASWLAASAVFSISGQPSNGDTITINGRVYTFQTVLTNVSSNVFIGASAVITLANLIAAVNLDSGSGTAYAAATTVHTTVNAMVGSSSGLGLTSSDMLVVSRSMVTGAAYTTAMSGTYGSWSAATFTGTTTYINPPFTAANATNYTVTMSVPGVAVGQGPVFVIWPTVFGPSMEAVGEVNGTDTVMVAFRNNSGSSSFDPVPSPFRVVVLNL